MLCSETEQAVHFASWEHKLLVNQLATDLERSDSERWVEHRGSSEQPGVGPELVLVCHGCWWNPLILRRYRKLLFLIWHNRHLVDIRRDWIASLWILRRRILGWIGKRIDRLFLLIFEWILRRRIFSRILLLRILGLVAKRILLPWLLTYD